MSTSRIKGHQIEQRAKAFLERNQLQTITCNYSTRNGEIDLIMRDRDTLVFVEVRYRKRAQWGTALETIDTYKQKKIISAAQSFLLQHPYPGPLRFDVIAYQGQDPTPQWVQNAFEDE